MILLASKIKEQTNINNPFMIEKKIEIKPVKRKKKGIREPELSRRLGSLFNDKKARTGLIPQTKITFRTRRYDRPSTYEKSP